MEITEKVAYLKGLMEGLGIDDSNKEGKVLRNIVDLLEDIAYTVSDIESGMSMVAEQVDMLDSDLVELQEDFYGDEDDDDDDCHQDTLYQVTCPSCGDEVYLDEDMLEEGEINCPGCGEVFEFPDDVVGGCSCGCDE